MNPAKKPLHFTLFTFPPYVHHYPETWRHPQDMGGGIYRQSEPDVWVHDARILEAMRFDALFVGDVGGIFNSHRNSPDAALRGGTQSVQFIAPLLAALAAGAAPSLGVISTISTMELHPWTTARLLNTMDHLTKGRVGWNVVTSANPGLLENLGIERIGHDERYEMSEEYLELCYRLWESWEEDALVLDRELGLFADPEKVHETFFEGEHYRCRGPLAMPRSPQTHPVIVQAGQSERGRSFAARHAEVMFTLTPSLPAMQRHYADTKARLAEHGREPEDLAILPGVMPIVGASEAEAEEKYATMQSIATVEAGLSWVSGYTGWDFSAQDPDTPLAALNPTEFYGVQSAFEMANPGAGDLDPTPYMRKGPESDQPTIRDLGIAHAEGIAPKIVGTAPQVADQLESIVDEGGGDGFMFSAVHHPLSLQEFAPVIAELQRRGRYPREYSGATLRDRLGTRPLPAASPLARQAAGTASPPAAPAQA